MAYGTAEGFAAYLAASGRFLPTCAVASVALQWGSAYVNMFEDRYKGEAVALPDSFPRDLWPVVPLSVEYAAYEAAYAWASGSWDGSSTGGSSGGAVIREKVDVLEVQYAAPQEGQSWWDANRFIIPLAYALLVPFFKPEGKCGGAGAAFVV